MSFPVSNSNAQNGEWIQVEDAEINRQSPSVVIGRTTFKEQSNGRYEISTEITIKDPETGTERFFNIVRSSVSPPNTSDLNTFFKNYAERMIQTDKTTKNVIALGYLTIGEGRKTTSVVAKGEGASLAYYRIGEERVAKQIGDVDRFFKKSEIKVQFYKGIAELKRLSEEKIPDELRIGNPSIHSKLKNNQELTKDEIAAIGNYLKFSKEDFPKSPFKPSELDGLIKKCENRIKLANLSKAIIDVNFKIFPQVEISDKSLWASGVKPINRVSGDNTKKAAKPPEGEAHFTTPYQQFYERNTNSQVEKSIGKAEQKIKKKRVAFSEHSNIRPTRAPRGIQNIGNSCWVNAAFQCVLQDPFLRESLEKLPKQGEEFKELFAEYDAIKDGVCFADKNFANKMKGLLLQVLIENSSINGDNSLINNLQQSGQAGDAGTLIRALYKILYKTNSEANVGLEYKKFVDNSGKPVKGELSVYLQNGKCDFQVQLNLYFESYRAENYVPESFLVTKNIPLATEGNFLELKVKPNHSSETYTYECDYIAVHGNTHWYSLRKVNGTWYKMDDAVVTKISEDEVKNLSTTGGYFHYRKK